MMLPEHIREVYAKATKIFSKNEIESALDAMAYDISAKLADANPVFLCVVIGGIVPMGNLLPRLDFPLEVDYVHATRYGDGFVGKEKITWKAKPGTDLKGRIVVVVDDILDEGHTLAAIMNYCKEQGAKAVYSAVLVDKKKERNDGGVKDADFRGLLIEDVFVFGYGMDYKDYLRNAPGIFAAAPEHAK